MDDKPDMESYWLSEQVYFEGDDYFRSLLQDIDAAKSSITIEVYMFLNDSLGKKVQEALIRARERGVHIQIIVDGIGSYEMDQKFIDRLHQVGIKLRVYNPLPFYHPFYGNLTWLKKFRVTHKRTWRMNKRNHRKIFIIDEDILYTGSFNITAIHTTEHTEKAWQDMGVRVTGPNVKFGTLNFKKNWKLRDYTRYKRYLRKSGSQFSWKTFPLRLNQNLLMRKFFFNELLRRLRTSESKIWLTTPYFVPKRKLIRALAQASRRGVDVTVLISQKSDVPFFRTLQYFYYGYLLKNNVKIYHYTNTVLHAKNYIIDDWMTIGSSNLNHRSFLHDLEVDLIILSDENKKKVEEHFQSSLVQENKITQDVLDKRHWLDKLVGRILFTFKYWF